LRSTGARPQRRTTLVTKKAPAKKPAVKKAASKSTKKTAKKTAKKPATKKASAKKATVAVKPAPQPEVLARILASLEDDKAEEIVAINLAGRSSLCDAIVVASGRSSRHVASIAEHLARRLKEAGYGTRPVNGAQQGDWALVDAGDVIVHIFRPEVRTYYDLESMWSVEEPKRSKAR
jgi:ribosome-associated protein